MTTTAIKTAGFVICDDQQIYASGLTAADAKHQFATETGYTSLDDALAAYYNREDGSFDALTDGRPGDGLRIVEATQALIDKINVYGACPWDESQGVADVVA